MNALSVSYPKIRRVMQQLRSRKVNEKRFLITVNCFSLKVSICYGQNNCTVIRLMLLCCFTFL
jgi:hypothetical protein